MFKKKWPNRIVSSEGFEVVTGSRCEIIYQEKDKTLNVETELLAGGLGLVLYTRSINQWNNINEIITEDVKIKIINNIVSAMNFVNVKVEVAE